MPNLRNLIDKKEVISANNGNLFAYGTSEGVTKAWDTRGRGRSPDSVDPDERMIGEPPPGSGFVSRCIGPHCRDAEQELPAQHNHPVDPAGHEAPIVVPHLDHLEFMMTSGSGGRNIKFDKEAMKTMLRMALVQLDAEDSEMNYMNTPSKQSTDHYATIKFRTPGTVRGAGE